MTKPPILDPFAVEEQPRTRPCGHGLTGRRVRADLFRCSEDACFAARRRVLDHAHIWRPRRGTAEDQVLIAQVYADPSMIAGDVALYAAGFNAVWAVLPRPGFGWVIMARSHCATLFRDLVEPESGVLTEASL